MQLGPIDWGLNIDKKTITDTENLKQIKKDICNWRYLYIPENQN